MTAIEVCDEWRRQKRKLAHIHEMISKVFEGKTIKYPTLLEHLKKIETETVDEIARLEAKFR